MLLRVFLIAANLLVVASPIALAQEPEAPTIEAASQGVGLPPEWFGHWKGQVTIYGGRNASDQPSFDMELIVEPTEVPGTNRWTLLYQGAAGRSERNYVLICKDATRGEFVIDEKNGIVLQAGLLGDVLSSHFVTQNQRIWNSFRLVKTSSTSEIHFELFSADDSQANSTEHQEDGVKVVSIRPQVRQFARLLRDPQAISNPPLANPPRIAKELPAWRKLETEAYRGKQDDICFVNESIGWYVNGAGNIYKTVDGGTSWKRQLHQPGTFFRCVAFLDENHGFAGNIGPGYFPNVTDDVPLYETQDGGETWSAVTSIEGPPIVGLCALQVLKESFVNAGTLDTRFRLIGVGRVGGPVAMIVSDDLGKTWQQRELKDHAAMAFDVHFFNRNEGLVAAASHADVSQSNALLLSTSDGGMTWTKVWQSTRPYELTWKMAFPSRQVGYVTIQSYNPDPKVQERYVAKTTDGGQSWEELPLINDAKVREFGIAFLDEQTGWVGATPNGFQTQDGGKTWKAVEMGNAVNKIRLLKSDHGYVGYAIGLNVYRIDIPK